MALYALSVVWLVAIVKMFNRRYISKARKGDKET